MFYQKPYHGWDPGSECHNEDDNTSWTSRLLDIQQIHWLTEYEELHTIPWAQTKTCTCGIP